MVLAPHPDDEALATGGLLQKAVAAGAAARVVLVTDGDNNPWPQRWIERRWVIDAECRRRWGALRRVEALRSLEALGLREADATFLGFPDQGLMALWKRRDAATLDAFARELADWDPTVLLVPSPEDRHPDHRAVFALAMEALRRSGRSPDVFIFLIHRGFFKEPPAGLALALTEKEQATKLNAILCHETQTELSRARFTSYARPEEIFTPLPRISS